MRPLFLLLSLNRSQARSSPCFDSSPPPAGPGTSSSTPNRVRTPRHHDIAARTGCTSTTEPTAPFLPHRPNYSPRSPRTKFSPAPPSTTRARSPPSRGTNTHARCPPSFSSGRLRCKCSTSAPSCRPRTPRPRPRRPPYICCRRGIVPRRRRGEFSYRFACARGASGRVDTWRCSTSFCTARIAGRRGRAARRRRRRLLGSQEPSSSSFCRLLT